MGEDLGKDADLEEAQSLELLKITVHATVSVLSQPNGSIRSGSLPMSTLYLIMVLYMLISRSKIASVLFMRLFP